MKVQFTHKGGRQEAMSERYALVLSKLGRGSYMTRDMRAVETAPVSAAPAKDQAEDLDEMEADALHAIAQERGVKVHHKAGADKVRDALRQAK